MWHTKPLVLRPDNKFYPCVEIDGTSVIVNNNAVIWVFEIINHSDKQARIFCIMSNRRKETLLLFI